MASILHWYKKGQNQVPVYNSDTDSFMQVKVGSSLKLSQGQTEQGRAWGGIYLIGGQSINSSPLTLIPEWERNKKLLFLLYHLPPRQKHSNRFSAIRRDQALHIVNLMMF